MVCQVPLIRPRETRRPFAPLQIASIKGRRPLNRHRVDLNRRSSRLKRIFFEVPLPNRPNRANATVQSPVIWGMSANIGLVEAALEDIKRDRDVARRKVSLSKVKKFEQLTKVFYGTAIPISTSGGAKNACTTIGNAIALDQYTYQDHLVVKRR